MIHWSLVALLTYGGFALGYYVGKKLHSPRARRRKSHPIERGKQIRLDEGHVQRGGAGQGPKTTKPDITPKGQDAKLWRDVQKLEPQLPSIQFQPRRSKSSVKQ